MLHSRPYVNIFFFALSQKWNETVKYRFGLTGVPVAHAVV